MGPGRVLRHMYPFADIPVIQLSLNYNQPLSLLFRMGKELSPLRKRGVLILGSGNLVHNLMLLTMHAKPYPWAVEFDTMVKNDLFPGTMTLSSIIPDIPFRHSHILPASITFPCSALSGLPECRPEFFNETIFAGFVSMRGVVFGPVTRERI